MIISEKQVMQLMEFTRQLMAILLCAPNNEEAKNQYNSANQLLVNISNQQSDKLKEIE